jgi:hypothetical protein
MTTTSPLRRIRELRARLAEANCAICPEARFEVIMAIEALTIEVMAWDARPCAGYVARAEVRS